MLEVCFSGVWCLTAEYCGVTWLGKSDSSSPSLPHHGSLTPSGVGGS